MENSLGKCAAERKAATMGTGLDFLVFLTALLSRFTPNALKMPEIQSLGRLPGSRAGKHEYVTLFYKN
jgi:hypothetical protein